MAKTTRALSGAAKNAFLRRAVAAERGIAADTGERLTARLQEEIAQLRVREKFGTATDFPSAQVGAAAESRGEIRSCPEDACPEDASFDPYAPNVVVAVRTEGPAAARAALEAIASAQRLRALAAAQSLTVPAEAEGVDAIAAAIVAAAERRIAGRRAAAR